MQRWRDWQRRTGGQALEDFLSDCELRGVVHRFDFRPLPPRLKLELQYAVQHRVDDRRAIETSLIKGVNSTELDESSRRRAREALEEYGRRHRRFGGV